MKRIVAVGIIAVLACALFLVPYASAKVEITCSVYPEKAEFNTEFVYSITLTNPGYMSPGELKLIVGSYSNITREWEVGDLELEPNSSCEIKYGKIIIPTGESCTVKKRVQFTHHKLCQGAFKDWTETEKPDLREWDKAWYECFFIDSQFKQVSSCDGSGEPILKMPCRINFYNSHVEQNRAYKDLSFDYQVKVKANCEDRIELQVRNYNTSTSSDGWDKHGLKKYAGLDVYTNKTLTWHAVNLTLDNFREGEGLYKFVGNISESPPYSGPKIEERFDDPKVRYNETIKELLSFDYEVSAWVNWVKDSIMLEVYNDHLHEWEEKGIRNYATPGKNQKLRWESMNLCSEYFDDDHRGKYRFVGSYNKDELEIIGPTIEEKFYPLDVAPTQGTNTDTFNYSVTVNANICDKIELQVKNHTTTTNNDDIKWDSKGTRDYVTLNINKTLIWNNIKLNTHELDQFNDSTFRFNGTKVGINSSTSTGPFYPLDLSWRNPSVRPNKGLYLFYSKFGYCIEVKSTKVIDVKLRVYYPHKGEAVIADNTKSYTRGDRGNWKLICWNDTQPFVEEDEGSAAYKFEFYYKGTRINETERSGPSIGIAIFKDESLEPEIGTRETEFTFSVWVMAAKSDYVTLKVYDSNGDCVAERKSKDKTTKDEWKLFVFENVPFKVPPALGNASYEFLTGKDTKISFDGPELIEEEFGALIVTPEKGTNYTPFNFSIDFTTSKPRNVTLWARYDESEWELIESTPVASKRETILFRNITPSKVFRSIEWKCKGIVTESGITRTNWDIGIKWLNRSFSPKEEGWWYETFNFSVSLSANVPGEVVLMVKKDDTNVWMAVGKKPYTDSPNPQTLTWENERIFNFNNPYEGNTSYNFSFYWGKTGYAATPSYGPKLFIPLNISILSSNVIPNDGVLYNFKDYIFSDNRNKRFNFSITMTADKPTTVKLVLSDPAGNKHTLNDDRKCEYTTPYQPLDCLWTMIELPSGDVGEWEHTYTYYDTRFGGWKMSKEIFKGPDIIAVFNSYTLDPAPPIPYGEVCNVTVCMSGIEKVDVTLEAYNLIHNSWESVGTESYEPAGEECLRWVIDTFEVPFDKLRLKW